MTVECPHCHAQTQLEPIQKARRNISRLLIFAVVGIALAVALLVLLKQRKSKLEDAPNLAAPRQVTNTVSAPSEPSRPKSRDDLKLLGNVSVEKAKNSRLSYAMGTLKNDSEHQRYGVKVEVDLFDAGGNKLPNTANDYVQTLEPRKEWNFRALVLEPKAVTAKLASIQEDQ